MKYPKIVIASDGERTIALADGIFLGPGIARLDFSADASNGEPKATICLLDIDLSRIDTKCGVEKFHEALAKMTRE